MRTRNELYQAALRTVSARRQRAKAAAQDARAQAEAAVPELRAAEDALRACGVRCALAGARGAGRAEAAAALAEARQKRDALLAASGRSPQALEPKFTCPLCQDTGVAQGKTCQCVRREMQRLRREEIEAMSSLSVTRFDTMKLDYYPNTRDPQTGRSVRQYMAELLADLQDYAAAFDLDSEIQPGRDPALRLRPRRRKGRPARDRHRGRPADPGRPGHRVQLQLRHQHPVQPAERPAGPPPAHHPHHQHHRRRPAGKTLHRKGGQPHLGLRPLPFPGRRHPPEKGDGGVSRPQTASGTNAAKHKKRHGKTEPLFSACRKSATL